MKLLQLWGIRKNFSESAQISQIEISRITFKVTEQCGGGSLGRYCVK